MKLKLRYGLIKPKPEVTVLDHVEASPAKRQQRALLEHSWEVNRQQLRWKDTTEWYCNLRQTGYDFAHDGISSKALPKEKSID